MAIGTRLRAGLNRALAPLNIELGTLTAARQEARRLAALDAAGLFDRPVYSLLEGMASFDTAPLAAAYAAHGPAIERLKRADNPVGFVHDNNFFSTPDMEVLYLMVATLRPRTIVEIGCGNSTRVARQAILDGGLATQIIAIDPYPRADIAGVVDRFEQSRLEEMADSTLFESLEPNDILFVDSSHMLTLGNDVARIFCDIIPRLRPGIVLHFHDIFLPYEYPKEHLDVYKGWGEQYILHAFLQSGTCEVLWPGYHLQRGMPEVVSALPFLAEGRAQSFWFRLGSAP